MCGTFSKIRKVPLYVLTIKRHLLTFKNIEGICKINQIERNWNISLSPTNIIQILKHTRHWHNLRETEITYEFAQKRRRKKSHMKNA